MIPIIVLAGGLGMRMRPLTETTPKCLLPVAGHPFAVWQREWIRSEGFSDGAICYAISYHGAAVMDALGPSHRYIEDGGKLLGQVGAIRHARAVLGDPEWFYVLYGDVYPRCHTVDWPLQSTMTRCGALLDCGISLYQRHASTVTIIEVPPSYEIGSPEGYDEFCTAVSTGNL